MADSHIPLIAVRVGCMASCRLGRVVARPQRPGLTPETEPLDQALVSLRIIASQVVEHSPALAHDLEQTAPRVVVLLVGLEVTR